MRQFAKEPAQYVHSSGYGLILAMFRAMRPSVCCCCYSHMMACQPKRQIAKEPAQYVHASAYDLTRHMFRNMRPSVCCCCYSHMRACQPKRQIAKEPAQYGHPSFYDLTLAMFRGTRPSTGCCCYNHMTACWSQHQNAKEPAQCVLLSDTADPRHLPNTLKLVHMLRDLVGGTLQAQAGQSWAPKKPTCSTLAVRHVPSHPARLLAQRSSKVNL